MSIDEIIAGMTEAQKALVLASGPGGWGRDDTACGVEIEGARYRTAKALFERRLGDYTQGDECGDLYFNNQLGLAVRARLEEQSND